MEPTYIIKNNEFMVRRGGGGGDSINIKTFSYP